MSLGTVIGRSLRIPPAIGLSQTLARIGLALQWHPDLPKPETGSHVYLVSRPHWAIPTSNKHWSIYTQGYFYHLTVDLPGSVLVETTETTTKAKTTTTGRPVLNDEDLSNESTSCFQFYSAHRNQLALIAYEVGRTDYSSAEVRRIAEWIISHMHVYSRMQFNCQVFAWSLMSRLVMTKRDLFTFIGNGIQLVRWDTQRVAMSNGESNTHRSCRENGFEMEHAPLIQRRGGFSNVHLAGLAAFFDSRRTRTASLRIRTLYATSSHSSPPSPRLAMHTAKRELLLRCEDLKEGNWEDAFRGRIATNMEYYAQAKARKERGSRFARAELWWLERVGHVHTRSTE